MNILLVDDHRVLADALKSLLETQVDFNVVAIAQDVQGAMRCCDELEKLDLILMDVNLSENGPNGLQLTKQIKNKFPEIKILICSMHEEKAFIQQAKRVGADGYISKNVSGFETMRTIREVGNGNEAWPFDGLEDMPIEKQPTPTEMHVLKYIDKRLTTPQIGVELAMLETTVSTHRHHIMQKYNLRTQGELFDFAKHCMELYGPPPDPIFSKVLEVHRIQFKEKDVNLEFEGETDGFDNRTTQALSRVVEEEYSNIKDSKKKEKIINAVKNVYIELRRSSSQITFTIRNDGSCSEKLIENVSLKKILEAIGGGLTSTTGGAVVVTLRSKRLLRQILPWRRK